MTLVGESKLKGVHPDLVRVVRRAAVLAPGLFAVGETLRTPARQAQLIKSGASRTTRSRHIPATSKRNPKLGHAVDLWALVDGKVRWDWPLYRRIATVMKQAAALEKVAVEWGGTWRPLSAGTSPLHKSFPDGPHYQMPWKEYP